MNRLILLLAIAAALLAGCAQQTRTTSSVVDYLYPKQSDTTVTASIPQLNLPLRVGIAFVPDQGSQTKGVNTWSAHLSGGGLTESKKTELLEKVAAHFRDYEFVGTIDVIPSAYLTRGGSFANLDQIRAMYGIDVIALVSYDQVQFTDEGWLTLTYWTLVGAYVVSGEKNDTSTMLDTVVYDIPSRNMLFRAPGTSTVKGRATPINLSEELRTDSIKGFEVAADAMIINLDQQLASFMEKIKREPERVKLVHGTKYTGAASWTDVLWMLLAAIATTIYRKRHARAPGRFRQTSPD
jgi:rhombotail lipoprotein